MLFASLSFAAALAGVSLAQTPQGFTPTVNTKLDVLFNSTMVMPGQPLSKAVTAAQPQLALPNARSTETFLFVMMDLDVPAQNSSGQRRTLLHAMQTGFKPTAQRAVNSSSLLASTDRGPAAYIGPSPPASDTIAHRYVQLLFQQPANLFVQSSQFDDIQSRIDFDVHAFMDMNGLQKPVAANFFTVSGTSPNVIVAPGAGAMGTSTASGGIVRNTLQPFEGAAGKTGSAMGLMGLLAGLVAVAA